MRLRVSREARIRWTVTMAVTCVALLAFVSAGCTPGSTTAENADDGLQRFELVGTVISADPESRQVTIAHEEIVGFMAAMTMPFVADAGWVYEVVEGGEHITATLVYDGANAWLEDIILTNGPDDSPAATEENLIGDAVPGAVVPLIDLVDQDGETVTFADFRDGYLLFTFIYTNCPLPNFCPLMSSHFAAIHAAVETEPDGFPTLHIMSISIDPDHDTPTVLRKYGSRYVGEGDTAFERWSFTTGALLDLRDLADFVGLKYTPEQGLVLHNLRTVLVDPDGNVHRMWVGNTWEPAEVVEEIRSLGADS